jgi:hypothetical protein
MVEDKYGVASSELQHGIAILYEATFSVSSGVR